MNGRQPWSVLFVKRLQNRQSRLAATAVALFLATSLRPGFTGEAKVEGWI